MHVAVFDFDGTLADSFPWFCSVLNEVAADHGFRQIKGHEVEVLRRLSTREILSSLQVPLWKVPAIGRDMRARKAKAGIALFPGAVDALENLSAQGVRLAIVSSDDEANIRASLGAGLAEKFFHFSCGASLFGKAGKLKKVLALSGCPANEAVYVGDETRDAEAARAVGMRFAAVTFGYAAREALLAHAPDFVFDRPADLMRLVPQAQGAQ